MVDSRFRWSARASGLAVLLTLVATSSRAFADAPASNDVDATRIAADSPQASVSQFLSLARHGHFDRAGEYLDVPRRARAADAAEKLALVLDREVWIDVERLSPDSMGDVSDGLPRGIDEVGTMPSSARGIGEPIRIARAMTPSGPRWRFSRTTCARIDTWYAALDGRALRAFVPPRLLRDGPFHIQPWQWIGLGAALIASLLLGALVVRLVEWTFSRTRATGPTTGDRLRVAIRGPLHVGWALAAFHVVLPFLGLVRPAEDGIVRIEKLVLALVFLIGSIRAVGVAAEHLSRSEWGLSNPASRSLVRLSARSAHLAAFLAAVLMTLSTLGYDVSGVLTGVGISGIVLALAAQKTLENLLGAFAIGIDQPLREGDLVKIGEVTGTVERVGLRSTRVRTLDRHVVAFPNGKLADTPIESVSARDRMRISTTLGIQHGTSVAQLRALRDELERVARANPSVRKEELLIRFSGVGVASLDIDVIVWLDTRDYAEFLEKREELFFTFLESMERLGVALATAPRPVVAAGTTVP